MVTIKFYNSPVEPDHTVSNHTNLIEYLCDSGFNKEQLLDLRFFHDEILGQEIDQSDQSFLALSDGVIAVTFDSAIPRTPDIWIYIAISVIVSAVTFLLTPKPPGLGNTGQNSATNKLGNSTNEPRIGERIDDIFGTVNKHTPPLWQVPYRIGFNNQETEVMLVCIGRGKYQLFEDEIFDGNTRVIDIPNAQFSKYEPGTYPGNGVPSLKIGDSITEKIGIYRQSNDLNPAELLPPNDLENSGLKWQLTGVSPTTGLMKATFIPVDFDFEEYYKVGDIVILENINYFEILGTTIVYYRFDPSTVIPQQFTTYKEPVDLGNNAGLRYEITQVTTDSITVRIPSSASNTIKSAWSSMTNYNVVEQSFYLHDPSNIGFITLSLPAGNESYYKDEALTIPLTVTVTDYSQLVSRLFRSGVGPFTVPSNADEIILNFTSSSGFYKLVNNNETAISDIVSVRIEEVDINGDTTGLYQLYDVPYDSNDSVRRAVFQTKRITVPYTRCVVSASRVGNRDKSEGVSNVDIITWRDLYSFESVSGLNFGDVTLAHIVTPSNSESQLIKERKQNMNVTRLITEYQGAGVFGPAESFATDDFSQILVHTSLDPRIGRLTLDNINADGFLALSDQIKTYFNDDSMVKFGYDFDDTNLTYQDTFIRICDVVNCLPYAQNGVYDAFFERLQPTSSMQITCRNKIVNSETREQTFEREFDGVELSYRDELTAIDEVIYLPVDQSAINPDRISLPGCTTATQAYRYAARKFNKQKHSRVKVTFDVDEFGRNIIPGKRIDSPDSTRFTQRNGVIDGYRVYDGEVIEVSGLQVELSEPVSFLAGEDHYIVFTNNNGDNSEAILCTYVSEFVVLLNTLPTESIYDGYSKDRAKYTLTSEQLRESIALIPQTIEFKMDDDGNEINTIGSVNYSDQYYKNDLEFPV